MSEPRSAPHPDNAAQAAALSVIAYFAVAQEEIDSALSSYLDSTLTPEVKAVLEKRLRLSDGERLAALVALARAVSYPLHARAYQETHAATKVVRDRLAHGGLHMTGQDEATQEPGLLMLGGKAMHYLGLTELRTAEQNARWLSLVARRVNVLCAGQSDPIPPGMREPSDLPKSAVVGKARPRGVDVAIGDCPAAHADMAEVRTRYGDASLCRVCGHVRVRDDAELVASREALSRAQDATP